jgi:hypothetical protein
MRKRNQDSLGRFMRADGTPAPPPDPSAKPVHRRATQFKHFRVDAVLTDEQRGEYEKLLAHPNTTVKQLQAWLGAHGPPVCRSAVTRHRQDFHSGLKRMREIAHMASSFCELTRTYGPGAVAEASHGRFEMMLMESLFDMPDAKQMPLADWQAMSKTVQGVVATRRSVEQMRSEFEAKAKQAAAEAAAAAAKNVSSAEVAERVREILGVNWPPDSNDSSDDKGAAGSNDQASTGSNDE